MSDRFFVPTRGVSYIYGDLLRHSKTMAPGAEQGILLAELSLLRETLRRLEDRFLPPHNPQGTRQ
jgi:hypothetical protein